MGPRAGLGAMEKIKILRLPGIEPVAIPTGFIRSYPKLYEMYSRQE
jgi:hypothetical protein